MHETQPHCRCRATVEQNRPTMRSRSLVETRSLTRMMGVSAALDA